RDDLAAEASARWLALNERTYQTTGKMMEKYDVRDLRRPAGGGEYPAQDGFGWTNGVVLALEAAKRRPSLASDAAARQHVRDECARQLLERVEVHVRVQRTAIRRVSVGMANRNHFVVHAEFCFPLFGPDDNLSPSRHEALLW